MDIDTKPPTNDDEGCCTTINGSKEVSPMWLILLGLFVVIRRRR